MVLNLIPLAGQIAVAWIGIEMVRSLIGRGDSDSTSSYGRRSSSDLPEGAHARPAKSTTYREPPPQQTPETSTSNRPAAQNPFMFTQSGSATSAEMAEKMEAVKASLTSSGAAPEQIAAVEQSLGPIIASGDKARWNAAMQQLQGGGR